MNIEDTIDAMAEAIPLHIDLDDPAKVAIALILHGFHGADIGDDLPVIIDRARKLRGVCVAPSRNQITDIAATAAQF